MIISASSIVMPKYDHDLSKNLAVSSHQWPFTTCTTQ